MESNKGHHPNPGKSWERTNPKQAAPKPPRKDKKTANPKLDATLPLNLRTFDCASPPLLFQPRFSNQRVIPFSTSKAGKGEETSITVVLSLLAALRKKTKPIANKIVNKRIEENAYCISNNNLNRSINLLILNKKLKLIDFKIKFGQTPQLKLKLQLDYRKYHAKQKFLEVSMDLLIFQTLV